MSSQLEKIAAIYGYNYTRSPNDRASITEGDDVVIHNSHGTPIAEGTVETVTPEALKVGGHWWYDFECSFRKVRV